MIILNIIAMVKIFEKAGRPGWHAIIPVLNYYDLFEIGWGEGKGMYCLFIFLPPVLIVMHWINCVNLAKAFGKESGFAAGLILLAPIFFPILGLGSAQYIGPEGVPAGGYMPGYQPDYNQMNAPYAPPAPPANNYNQMNEGYQPAYNDPANAGYAPPPAPDFGAPAGYADPAPVQGGYGMDAGATIPMADVTQPVSPSRCGIEILTGSMSGQKFPIQEDTPVTVGRSLSMSHGGISFSPDYSAVSHNHMEIKFSSASNAYVITDHSSNGTFIGSSKRLQRGAATTVAPGSTLTLGSDACRIRLM